MKNFLTYIAIILSLIFIFPNAFLGVFTFLTFIISKTWMLIIAILGVSILMFFSRDIKRPILLQRIGAFSMLIGFIGTILLLIKFIFFKDFIIPKGEIILYIFISIFFTGMLLCLPFLLIEDNED